MTSITEDSKHAVPASPVVRDKSWQLLATWALLSAVIVFSAVPDFLVIVPTATAAALAATKSSSRTWLMFAITGAAFALLVAFSSLFAWSTEYPATVVG